MQGEEAYEDECRACALKQRSAAAKGKQRDQHERRTPKQRKQTVVKDLHARACVRACVRACASVSSEAPSLQSRCR